MDLIQRFKMYLFEYDNSTDKLSFDYNAIEYHSVTAGIVGVSDINGQTGYTLFVGQSDNATPLHLDGEIAEIIIFDKVLTDDERAKVNYYLSTKWGLESSIDSDGDGTLDELDVFPMDATEFEDTDSDGTGNNADTDDDNDGYSDAVETAAGTSTIDASDIPTVDLSDSVDAQIGVASGLDTIESNLSLWLDASNIDAASNATLSDGDAISEWKDLSGNGNHGLSLVDRRPTLMSDSFGDKINFAGLGGFVIADNSTIDLGTDFTFIFVYEATTLGRLVQKASYAAEQIGAGEGFIDIGVSGRSAQFSSTDMPTGTIIINNIKTQNVLTQLYANGSLMTNELSYPVVNYTDNNQNMAIGSNTDGYTTPYFGTIREVIVFSEPLTDDERIKVNYYLSTKWGLESSVDSDGDGTLDELDVFPMDATEFEDTDSDGTGNNADTDDDNDGYSDAIETAAGTSTIDASDIPTVDLSDSVDAQIGEASGLDTIEANLSLWLDASNIDAAVTQHYQMVMRLVNGKI